MNSQADSQKFKKMVLNSVQEKQVLKNHPRGVVFVRSEQGPFFVWAQPDWTPVDLETNVEGVDWKD